MLNKEELLELAKDACDTVMTTFTPDQLPPAGHFHYHQGVFLEGVYRLFKVTGDEKYLAYIKGYYDHLIDENGNLFFDRDQLDSLQVGLLLFPLFEATKDQRYLTAAKKLLHIIEGINQTTEGGFWHKDKYPYQMWLDGLYMAGPFLLACSRYFQLPELTHQVVYQEQLMRSHMYSEQTGLLFHAWDEKKVQPWANPQTGCSPEVWGRSAGWYGTALVDILELLPTEHGARQQLEIKVKEYADVVMKYQDAESRCWYQVLDKGNQKDNWLEASCSALFIYTLAKGLRTRILADHYQEIVEEALAGLIQQTVIRDGHQFTLSQICIGTSAGTYDYYVERPTSENDLHGVGAFVWAVLATRELL